MEQEKKHTWHPKLNAHRGIGIDIDATLIHGPCSQRLQEWVSDHYMDLDLHLVTFRHGADFEYISQDIGEFGMKLDMFKGVHGIDPKVSVPYWLLQQKVGYRVLESDDNRKNYLRRKWLRGLTYAKSSEEQFVQLHAAVADWKGFKCKELGLTALVDDLEDMVLPGCTAHGVEWIDSLSL